ncbi:uncharacterized protein LOC131892942 [Tigriopus californicus]|uniref:uncharacterized protein LOC131892942 n=1 Tax=Tigriopus californicus TaxID=6832 RepID=UPI0027D9FA37|nr:uncharacterized protein LOC131892942 [Tigriopus californicus]
MLIPWIILTASLGVVQESHGFINPPKQAEFVAGSFIITQKSLNEAPYRYAGILRKALDKVEQKDPPSKSDEESCSVRYRINPSGRPSKLRIIDESLSIVLRDNNTVIVAAKIFAEVAAKTWIWKGIYLLFGCVKLSSCNGQIVTYKADIDFQIGFQAFWIEEKKKLSFFIKPVNTAINNVEVSGCHPPWYLSWFKTWQDLLNAGVQEGFEDFARTYEHQAEIPEGFSPLDNVFIHYKVTNLIWNKHYVIFQANATFSALIDGKNQTFIPTNENRASVPIDNWKTISPKDGQSHLLQGVRVSTEFLNSLMWYATVTNVTRYSGNAQVLDSFINGTISYSPPEIRVEKDELLGIKIPHGLVLATCRPVTTSDTKTLFKAEFYDLAGSGRVKLKTSLSNKTGLTVSLNELDLSNMNTKPFEPKLPLPEAFEEELMRSAMAKLQPVVNIYLKSKPLYLPDNISPFADAPEMHLVTTGNGTGFAEILSYCTCSKTLASAYSNCDSRSHICDGKIIDIDLTPFDKPEDGDDSKVINSIKDGIKGIFGAAKDVISRRLNQSEPRHIPKVTQALNFPAIFEQSVQNITYFGFHLTFFEDDFNCKLNKFGSRAKVYWLWQTSQCTPLFLQGKNSLQYYYLNATTLKFGCGDEFCQSCQYPNLAVDPIQKEQCNELNDQSYQVGSPVITRWEMDQPVKALVANVFFDEEFCSIHQRYVEPQLISSHTNLGLTESLACGEADSGDYINVQLTNETVKHAVWECNNKCQACLFRVEDVKLGDCHTFQHHVQIMFTQSVYRELALKTATPLSTNNAAIYVGIGSSVLIVFLGSLIIMFICKWNSKKTSRPSSSISFSKEKTKCSIVLKDLWTKHIGVRFLAWNKFEMKAIQEDVIQNMMLVINGVMAVVFAIEWNSDNNPLLTLHNKFSDGVSISVDIFNTDKVAVFADWLNLLTYFVNIINAVLAFLIVITWSFTKTGSRTLWMKVRLLSSVLLLSSIFVVIASVIFSTYFDDLVTLEKNQGVFITDNQSMYNMASKVLKVSLNGLSLTVISFTIVFLFHGVGGGLYFGTILFRLLHLHSKRSNMEILTTLLVILTVIQPFICLHPVIIWSQDSNHNSIFLILIILIWFLPVIVHAISKAVITHGRPKFISRINSHNHDSSAENKTNLSQSMRLKDRSKFEHRQRKLGLIFDFAVQVMQISFFLASFSIITHFIIHTEFNQNRKNLQDFVLPAIISVFCWMTSISYLLLSLVLDESRKDSRLVFKDQNLESARNLLRNSLKRRLQTLDHPSGPSNRRLPPLKPMRNLRRTLPANVSLSESLNGRDIHPEDSALVNVASRVKATPADVRQKVRKFEEIGLKPMVKRAEVYAKDPVEEISDPEVEVSVEDPNSSSCWSRTKRLYHFLVETREYKDPLSYGWRIKFRRIFLSLGVLLFTALTIYTVISTQDFSSKAEIQKLLDFTGTNLTWPDSGSVLDDVFHLYNTMERTKSYMMLGSVGLFWASLVFDFASHFAETDRRKSLLFTGSRITNFFGSLMVFASVIVVGLPDYLEASHLDEICPHCGENFNQTVRQVAEFSIGLFFACLFTFQLIPILITIIPALVRAAVLILIHPSLQIEDDDITSLRMTILQQVIQFASFLTFPITFISMAILQQYQKDTFVTMLIICFWTFPPFVLFLGLHYTRKYRRHKILIYIYYTYNTCYFVILTALVFYSMTFETIIETLEGMMREPTFWISSTSQVFLCNVVISDMLYMTVF